MREKVQTWEEGRCIIQKLNLRIRYEKTTLANMAMSWGGDPYKNKFLKNLYE